MQDPVTVCAGPPCQFVWEGLKVTPSPHQEHAAGLVKVAEGQMRHTTPYHTSPRPPMSTGGRHLKDTPPSALSYSQDGETGADGGAREKRGGWRFDIHNSEYITITDEAP
ncbi:hypothetical protein EYF80_008776 [Liparis tanakae]|uniref:Uncharacterized protein n=1 Tax=Liparis tanakae TaxID=230148 RepID=A0A4Z2IT05_9TELE|nr:hypothetical protein EYF80_008776 [Liparis tanakae]